MKEIMQLYVEYNRKTNRTLQELILQLPTEEIMKERKTYYKSIGGLVMHLIYSCRYMMSLIRKHWDNQFLVDEITADDYEVVANSPQEAFELLEKFDRLMGEFIDQTEEALFKSPQKSILIMGKAEAGISIWNIFMQYIVHQTHHRGQISQLLDELGVEHDIGNVWPLYLDQSGNTSQSHK